MLPRLSVLELFLFNIFTDDMDQNAPSVSFQMAQSWEEVFLPQGRKSLQKDLNRLDEWSEANCTMFDMTKCWVLHFVPNNSVHGAG